MAGILAAFGGSLVSGLAGPLLGEIPNIPGAAITNPYANMTSTGGNSVAGPLTSMLSGLLGGNSSSSSSSNSGLSNTATTTAGSGLPASIGGINTDYIIIGGGVLLLIILIK